MKRSGSGPAPWIALWCAAWLVFAVVYAMLLYTQSFGAMGPLLSIRVALLTMLAPAVMSIGVWRLTARFEWHRRRAAAFAAVHAAIGVAFAGVWAGWILAVARAGSGPGMSAKVLIHTALPWHVLTGMLVYALVAASSYTLRAVVHARNMELAVEHAERLRTQARLAALRAHIDPHFLFNTLHAVSALMTTDPAEARRGLERLSDIFRYTLRLDRDGLDMVTVEDEWKVVESYLWLEGLRLGPRLRVETSLDEEVLACEIPPFTLQPIVENAVRHGVSANPLGGTITITLVEHDGVVVIGVSDDGSGCDATRALESGGLGLRSVRERLAARYGGAASVSFASGAGGTKVVIRLPASVDASRSVVTSDR